MAEAAARHLVRAEAQGLPTHGMSRVPLYCGMLRRGRADGAAQPGIVADRAAERDRPRIGQAFIAIDPGALAGMDKFYERIESVIVAMRADPEVRLPGARRFAAEAASGNGIDVPEELLAQIEKLCST